MTEQEIETLEELCFSAYQIIGVLAVEAGRPDDDPKVIKILDNLSSLDIIHKDVLPFSYKVRKIPDIEKARLSLDFLCKSAEDSGLDTTEARQSIEELINYF